MADFETKLRWLSERGAAVGAEALIERIEADLFGDPLVVVAKRREGSIMTKTQQPPTTGQPGGFKGPGWALAVFVVILAVGGLYFAFGGDDGQVVDQDPVPTPTTAPSPAPNPTRLPEVGQGPIGPLDPGVYFAASDRDPSTMTGATFVIEGPGWMASSEGVSKNGVSLHLHQVDEVNSPGCERLGNPMPAGSTAADLADGFAASGFMVREAPAPVNAFGHDGHHVVVEVPEGCSNAVGWQWNIFLNPGDVMEAWIFDMDGQIVLVEAMWYVGAESPGITGSSEQDLAELRAVIDTLVLTS